MGDHLFLWGFTNFLTTPQTLLIPPSDRFQSIMDKTRTGRPLLTDDIACGFTSEEKPYHDDDGTHNEELARTSGHTATSSITTLSNEGGPNVE